MLDKIFFYLKTIASRTLYFIQPKNVLKIKAEREELAKDVLAFVDRHIGEMDPKYEEERILYKKEKDEDAEKKILLRRNSARKGNRRQSEAIDILLSNQLSNNINN
jgi:hypothetical protein